jgi:hypothetical protein
MIQARPLKRLYQSKTKNVILALRFVLNHQRVSSFEI